MRPAWWGFKNLYVVLGGIALLAIGGGWPIQVRLAAWTGWACLSFWATAPHWTWFFGPIFFYDLVRVSRKGRNTLLRCLYALSLLIALYLLFEDWFGHNLNSIDNLFDTPQLPQERISQFAQRIFSTFMMVQLAAVLLLTPAFAAGAIAEERERGTLDYVLTTDLTPREVVVGKLMSRLANLGLLLLAGLPVLSLTVFLGGIDPLHLIIGYATTFALMLGVGSLALAFSAHAETTLQALLKTYGGIVLLLSCFPCGCPFFCVGPLLMSSSWADTGELLFMAAGFGGSQLALMFLCLSSAINRVSQARGHELARHPYRPPPLPSWMEKEPPAARPATPVVVLRNPTRVPLEVRPPRPHPPVSDRAMLWKELHGDALLGRPNARDTIALILWFVLAMAAAILWVTLVAYFGPKRRPGWESLGQYLNPLIRGVVAVFTAILSFAIALAAACGVSREQERQTLDGLLTTPLAAQEILLAKLLGAAYPFRLLGYGLAGVWLAGGMTLALHPLALLVLPLAWLIQGAFCGALGLWLSSLCRQTPRALLLTLTILLLLFTAPWLLAGQFNRLLAGWGWPGDRIALLEEFQLFGLPMPAANWQLAFALDESLQPAGPIAAGLACYAVLGAACWLAAKSRLDALRVR